MSKSFDWAKWKRGLVISLVTTLLTELVIILADSNITWRAMAAVLVGGLAKDWLLYLKQHPAEEITNDQQPTSNNEN